jgi:iron complex outermembrane receptor protein
MVLAKPVPAVQWITTIKYTCGTLPGNDAIPLIPPLKSVSTLRYKIGKFDLQGEWEYAAVQHHVSTLAGEQATPAYSIVNFRTGVKPGERWKISWGIENLFDRRYREHLDWGNIMRPGRNFYLNLNFNF